MTSTENMTADTDLRKAAETFEAVDRLACDFNRVLQIAYARLVAGPGADRGFIGHDAPTGLDTITGLDINTTETGTITSITMDIAGDSDGWFGDLQHPSRIAIWYD